MYAFIEGTVAEKGHNELVIEAGGVGYALFCSMNTVQNAAQVGEKMRAYTYLSVKQDGVELFGFGGKEERELFKLLIGVSGVGPRTAIGILSSMPLKALTLAILGGDTATLSRAPGIGKKTAQRIALELKERLSGEDTAEWAAEAGAALPPQGDDPMSEALQALQALGYTQGEALQALKGVRGQSEQADELVRLALRSML